MPTECLVDSRELPVESFVFGVLGRREVVARFDGGAITSDAGGLLLREVEARSGIIARFVRGFVDHRDPELIEHTVEELIRQRVYRLCLGYEDLNDHDDLRHDPLLAVLVGKADPTGQDRASRQEHIESTRTDSGRSRRRESLSEDRGPTQRTGTIVRGARSTFGPVAPPHRTGRRRSCGSSSFREPVTPGICSRRCATRRG